MFRLDWGQLHVRIGAPKRPTVLLVRHGQSRSNVDRNVHNELPDALIPLSDLGTRQALEAGHALGRGYFAEKGWPKRIRVFHSEYLRAEQTANLLMDGLRGYTQNGVLLDHKSDSRIHELEFGWMSGLSDAQRDATLTGLGSAKLQSELLRKHGAKFFDRRLGGESPADVEARLRTFFNAIYRDRDENGIDTFIVVSHGLTNRVFAKAWLGKDFHWYEQEENPRNCAIRLMTPARTDGGYIHFGGMTGLDGQREETPTEGH